MLPLSNGAAVRTLEDAASDTWGSTWGSAECNKTWAWDTGEAEAMLNAVSDTDAVTAEATGTTDLTTRVDPCKPILHNEINRLRKQAVKNQEVCFGIHSKAEGL